MSLGNTSTEKEILSALSIWIPASSITKEGNSRFESNDTMEKISTASNKTLTIPMVYSHEHWFEIALLPVSTEIGRILDKEGTNNNNDTHLCHMLIMANQLIRRVSYCYCPRERMTEFLNPCIQLLRCSEKPSEVPRRLAQQTFMELLNRFQPIAQFLLLSYIFKLIFTQQITLSEEIYEPQMLAYLVDIFRQKCFSPSTSEECKSIFRSQLGKFYNQLAEIVYEDPLIAINFYTAVLILITAQAIHRVHIVQLKSTAFHLIEKFRRQLRDWTELQQRRSRENQETERETKGLTSPSIATEIKIMEHKQKEHKEYLDKQRLAMFAFQLNEAERRVEDTLESLPKNGL